MTLKKPINAISVAHPLGPSPTAQKLTTDEYLFSDEAEIVLSVDNVWDDSHVIDDNTVWTE